MKNYHEMAESVLERRDKYYAERRNVMNRYKKIMSGVVCCCLMLLFTLGIVNGGLLTGDETDYTENTAVQEQLADKNGQKGQIINHTQNGEEKAADENGEYYEDVGSDSLSQKTSAFFGGSYTDTNGDYVVVLTVDTAENRASICKELGISEGTTVFKTGTYTLKYLTELQSKISAAMVNKELPFVTSSAVYETINKIKVSVTTKNKEQVEKLLAFDSIGGAIEIEYSEGIAAKDMISVK